MRKRMRSREERGGRKVSLVKLGSRFSVLGRSRSFRHRASIRQDDGSKGTRGVSSKPAVATPSLALLLLLHHRPPPVAPPLAVLLLLLLLAALSLLLLLLLPPTALLARLVWWYESTRVRQKVRRWRSAPVLNVRVCRVTPSCWWALSSVVRAPRQSSTNSPSTISQCRFVFRPR